MIRAGYERIRGEWVRQQRKQLGWGRSVLAAEFERYGGIQLGERIKAWETGTTKIVPSNLLRQLEAFFAQHLARATDTHIAIGCDLMDSTAAIGLTSEQLYALSKQIARQESAALAKIEELSTRLDVTRKAVESFFRILKDNEVPPEGWEYKLTEIAKQHRHCLTALRCWIPKTRRLKIGLNRHAQRLQNRITTVPIACCRTQNRLIWRPLSRAEQLARQALDAVQSAPPERRHNARRAW